LKPKEIFLESHLPRKEENAFFSTQARLDEVKSSRIAGSRNLTFLHEGGWKNGREEDENAEAGQNGFLVHRNPWNGLFAS
jgi:hypothetical protein